MARFGLLNRKVQNPQRAIFRFVSGDWSSQDIAYAGHWWLWPTRTPLWLMSSAHASAETSQSREGREASVEPSASSTCRPQAGAVNGPQGGTGTCSHGALPGFPIWTEEAGGPRVRGAGGRHSVVQGPRGAVCLPVGRPSEFFLSAGRGREQCLDLGREVSVGGRG